MNAIETITEAALRPLVGLTCDIIMDGPVLRHTLRDAYVAAILEAGGAPVLIPNTGDRQAARAVYESLDGLVLTGGGDIDPTHYQEARAGTEIEGILPQRDATELYLARWALDDDLPVLGICRGQQLLNVAAGGSLYQDIPGQLPHSPIDHRGSTHTGDRGVLAHPVRLEAGCKLAAIFGTTEVPVNSLHHQGVRRVGQGLRVVGVAPDGMPEALESEQHRWVVAVQWHPEELFRRRSEAAGLFRAFVEQAALQSLNRPRPALSH